MTLHTGTVVPRSQISLGIGPTLQGSLARLVKGRVIVIDPFASRRCSVVIGDLTADFSDTSPGPGYLELASIERVRIFAESRLLAVFGAVGSTLRLGGPPFARHLSVELVRPELWIDFLDGPGVLAGKRRVGWRRPKRTQRHR